jgi:hypothetical protein
MNQVSRISLVLNIRVMICHSRQQKLREARYDRTPSLFSIEETNTFCLRTLRNLGGANNKLGVV